MAAGKAGIPVSSGMASEGTLGGVLLGVFGQGQAA